MELTGEESLMDILRCSQKMKRSTLQWPVSRVMFPTYFGALILAAIVRNTIGFVNYKEDDGEDQSSGRWENAEKTP